MNISKFSSNYVINIECALSVYGYNLLSLSVNFSFISEETASVRGESQDDDFSQEAHPDP
jgi:hypothetical protein